MLKNLRENKFLIKCYSLFGIPLFTPDGTVLQCLSGIRKWSKNQPNI